MQRRLQIFVLMGSIPSLPATTGINMKYLPLILRTIRVHNKHCMGCRSRKKDVMISVQTVESEDITDVFLTTTQAENFIIDLEKTLRDNKNG